MVGVGSRAGTAATGIVLLLAAALVLLLAAQPSQARNHVDVTITGHVRLESGIRVDVTADGAKGPDRVYMGVSRSGGPRTHSAFSTYYEPLEKGRPTSGRRIISGLGERGAMRLSYEPRGKPEERGLDSCLRLTERQGVLEGFLRFRGERRYVEIDEHRLKATRYKIHYKDKCLPTPAARSRILELTSCTSGGTSFHALSGFPRGRSLFYGEGPQIKKRGLRLQDATTAEGALSDFSYSDNLKRAKLTPPSLFTGSARYKDGELTGDLTMPTIRGPEFALTPGTAEFEGGGSGPRCDREPDALQALKLGLPFGSRVLP